MSLRLADENAVRGSEKADTKQAAVAKVDIRSKSRKLADENVSHAHGKNSKVPEKPEKRVPKHPENKKQNSEATKDSALDIVDRICDIDADDGEYLEFCSKYVKKIYDHLFLEEAEHPVRKDYLQLYADLRPSMRGILIEWLVFLQNRFRLLQDTLLMAVSIMDRMLSTKKAKITRQNFQLLGATCLWIAAKYEEMYHPSVNDFVFACADYYTRLDFRTMETHILTTLGFQFSKPLSSHFLRRFSKAAGGDTETHQTAKYLIELSLYAYDLVDSLPSVIAAAALFVAGRATGKIPSWSRILQFYSRYKPENFRREALKIAEIAVNPLKDSYLKTTVEKYSKTKVQSNTQLFTNDFLVELSRSLANA